MPTGTALIAIVAALVLGYYFAQWRRSEGSLRTARTLADGAGRSVWRARRNLLLTCVGVVVLIYLWSHGLGR